MMDATDKWGCVDSVEEELNYEYSDDDHDEVTESCRSSPENDFHLAHLTASNYICSDSDEAVPQKTLIREFSPRKKIQSRLTFKRRWRRHNYITGYLKRWRIRSCDHIFNLHKKAPMKRLQVSQNEHIITDISYDESKELEQLSEIAVIVNNDLCKVSTVTNLYDSTVPVCSNSNRIGCRT